MDGRNLEWLGMIAKVSPVDWADPGAKQPYLLSLGMSKSLLALVWIAGPLSGTLVQPYVGIMSDNCRVSWGKRKPYMLAGAAATIISLVALAWAREIVSGVLGIFGAGAASSGVKLTAITFAIFVVYVLDCAINTGMQNAIFVQFSGRPLMCPVQYKLAYGPSSLTMRPHINRKMPMRGPVVSVALAISWDTCQATSIFLC